MSGERIIDEVFREFYRRLLYHLFDFWFTEDGRLSGKAVFAQDLASHLFLENKDIHIGVNAAKPLVFIGAPAREFAEGLKRHIDVRVVVPPHHGVANAVGAITGAIREDVRILIRPRVDGGYVAYAPDAMLQYETLAEAKREMTEYARRSAARKARRSGALSLNVDVKIEDREVKISGGDVIYLETVITATVASIPIMKT